MFPELAGFEGLGDDIVVDSSEKRASYLITGKNGSQIKLSPGAYRLLQIAHSDLSMEEAVLQIQRHQGRAIDPAALRQACQRVVDHVLEIDRTTDRSALPKGFWLRIPFLSERVVGSITPRLSFLFEAVVAIPLLVVTLVVLGYMLAAFPESLDSSTFWPAYGLFLVSLLFHELGHSAACHHFGAKPYAIGVTLYLIYPAFYSDVSDAWRLRRWQRVVVDLGGIYFQSLAACAYVLVFTIRGADVYALAFWMILYGSLFSLNPIFRFDGYWLLSDALGVTNLGSQPFVMVKRLLSRLRGGSVEPLPWTWPVAVVLALYTPATFLFLGYFLWRLIPIASTLVRDYPPRAIAILSHWATGQPLPEGTLDGFGMSTFFAFLILVVLWRLAQVAWRGSLRLGERFQGGGRVVPGSSSAGPEAMDVTSSEARP